MQHSNKRTAGPAKRHLRLLGVLLVLTATAHLHGAERQAPTAGHDALAQFAGDWTMTGEILPPGQDPIQWQGTEQAGMVGGFWLASRMESSMMGMPVTSLTTIGYDPESGAYVGTYVSSLDSIFWQYRGRLDESGRRLTLETTGPSALDPTRTATYRDTLETIDENRKTFTSSMLDDDGNWLTFVTLEYRRMAASH